MNIDFSKFQPRSNNLNKNIDSISFIKKPSLKSFSKIKTEDQKIEIIKKIGYENKRDLSDFLFQILEKETNDNLIKEIYLSLGRLKEPKIIPTLIDLLLNSSDAILRKEIISIFSKMKPQREIIYALEQLILWDGDLQIRIYAIDALTQLNAYLSVFTLEQVFTKEKNLEIKKKILESLSKIAKEEAREFLSNQIEQENNYQILREIVWALTNLEIELEEIQKLTSKFEKLPHDVQKTLVWSLARSENNLAKKELIKLLLNRSLSNEIILEMIQACGRYRIKLASKILLKILRDGDAQSKQNALWALVALNDQRFIPFLAKRLKKEKNHEIRDEIKKALNYLVLYGS